MSHTPEKKSAFDNQCINPDCSFIENQTHKASKGEDGINRTHKSTPIRCEQCDELLPRPWVEKSGEFRLMKGYTSAYKRMSWSSPASALTRNFSYACSDNKLHPSQNRVLSLYEAFIIHTIDQFDYDWGRWDRKKVSDKCIREIIGESIPPKGLATIFNHMFNHIVSLKSLDRADRTGRAKFSKRKTVAETPVKNPVKNPEQIEMSL